MGLLVPNCSDTFGNPKDVFGGTSWYTNSAGEDLEGKSIIFNNKSFHGVCRRHLGESNRHSSQGSLLDLESYLPTYPSIYR